MNKARTLMSVIALVILAVTLNGAVAQSISVGSKTCAVGDYVTVPINVSLTDATGIGFTLNFNPEIVQAVNLSVLNETSYVNIDNSSGKVNVSVIFNTPYTGNGTLILVEFHSINSGFTYLNLTKVEYSDENFTPHSMQVVNGSISVKGLPDLVGILHIYNEFGEKTWKLKIHKAGDTWSGNVYGYPFVVLNASFEIRNLNPNVAITNPFKLTATYRDKSFSYEITNDQLRTLNERGVLYINATTVLNATNIGVGCYKFSVFVDSDNNVRESNESNNNATYTLCLTKPDLVPILSIPNQIVPGNTEFTVGVENIGDVWAKSTTLKVYINGTTSKEFEFNVPILMPNDTWTTNLSYNFENGNYDIKVVANYNYNDTELNYENNIVEKTLNVNYYTANTKLSTNVSKVKYGDEFNLRVSMETQHPVGEVHLELLYSPYYSLEYVSSTSPYNISIKSGGWKWLNNSWYRVLDIDGSGLNLNGSIDFANVTFKVTTVRKCTASLILDGTVKDINGATMVLNSSNISIEVLKYTDLAPYIWGYNTQSVEGNFTFKVTVRNLVGSWSNPFNLTVEIINVGSGNVVKSWVKRMDSIRPIGYNVTEYSCKLTQGSYRIKAIVDNDTYTANNIAESLNISVKKLEVDVWTLWYPYWKVEKGGTFWIGWLVNSTVPAEVNVTINVPKGLLVYNGSNWVNSYTFETWVRGWKWQSMGVLAKAVDIGKYGNGTNKEINVTIKIGDKILDTINSTKPKDLTDWIPTYPLVVYIPTITLYSDNSTVLDSNTSSSTMTFKTLNATTYGQNITIVVQAGQEGRILSGLDYLVQYPYGCVEQVASKMLGALHTDWYYRSKGYPIGYDQLKVSNSIKMGIESLAKGGTVGQNDNGSWSMWGWNPRGDGFYTMYASYGLGRVAEDSKYGYLVKDNLTETHAYNPNVNKGKFNFNDTIYWFANTAVHKTVTINGTQVEVIYWKPWQGTHWFFEGHLPVTAWVMVAHYQLVHENLVNASAKQIANQTMANVTKYLVSVQDADGGWNQWGDPNKQSDAISTALAVWGLKLYGTPSSEVSKAMIESSINRGINWLLTHYYETDNKIYWKHPLQSPWWDDYGRKCEATAYALIAMNESRSMYNLNFTVLDVNNATVSKAVNYLIGIYRTHGSFGYTEATQSALHALTLLQAVAVEPATVKISIDGVITKTVTVNGTNPRVVLDLTPSEVNIIDKSGTQNTGDKRVIHSITVDRVSGNGMVIVSVENKQTVARNEVVWGREYWGNRILSNEINGGTLVVNSMDSKVLSETQNQLDITPILPSNMVVGQSYKVKVKINNNNGTALISPIVKISLVGAKLDLSNVKWYDSELGWNSFTNSNMNVTSNYTVEFFPNQIPPKGYIELEFCIIPEKGSSNVSMDVEVAPMYANSKTYISSATASVKGYGTIDLKVFDTNGSAISAWVTMDGVVENNMSIKALEGTHTVKVEKPGYVPVEFKVDLNRNTNVTYSIVLAKPSELDKPMVIFAETNDFSTIKNSMTTLSDTGIIMPTAFVKAHRYFNLSIGGTGKKTIAVKVPEITKGSLQAWLNNSIIVTENGKPINWKMLVVKGTPVLLVSVNGSCTLNIEFKGKHLGDVTNIGNGKSVVFSPDGTPIRSNVTTDDAVAILQYTVGKWNTEYTVGLVHGLIYGDVTNIGNGKSVVFSPDGTPIRSNVTTDDAVAILQYTVGKWNTEYTVGLVHGGEQ